MKLDRLTCQVKVTDEQADRMKFAIRNGYHPNWVLDTLPGAAIGIDSYGRPRKRYAGGFPIGFIATDTRLPYVYNHVNIHIDYHYHHHYSDKYHVVGFAVQPLSVAQRPATSQQDFSATTCSASLRVILSHWPGERLQAGRA